MLVQNQDFSATPLEALASNPAPSDNKAETEAIGVCSVSTKLAQNEFSLAPVRAKDNWYSWLGKIISGSKGLVAKITQSLGWGSSN